MGLNKALSKNTGVNKSTYKRELLSGIVYENWGIWEKFLGFAPPKTFPKELARDFLKSRINKTH